MCRLVAYKGSPIPLDDLLFSPKHSLIKQSYDAKELEEPLNGDGFGIGWYVPEVTHTPAVFVSMTPAWSNRNLKNLAPRIKSNLIFAHVRAASVGDISEANCHPFYFDEWMFMHNGGIEGFSTIKREVRRSLSDTVYNWLRGQTDSEHFFALLLDSFVGKKDKVTPDDIMDAYRNAIHFVIDANKRLNTESDIYLNTCISNGKFIVATRYCNNPKIKPLSLYYSTGTRYVCENGVCQMVQVDPKKQAALIVSEKLTEINGDWHPIPDNHFVVINENNGVTLKAIF